MVDHFLLYQTLPCLGVFAVWNRVQDVVSRGGLLLASSVRRLWITSVPKDRMVLISALLRRLYIKEFRKFWSCGPLHGSQGRARGSGGLSRRGILRCIDIEAA